MNKILEDFINNDEANDAYVTAKVTYISIEDVQALLDKQEKQLILSNVGSLRELLQKIEKVKTFEWGIDPSDNERRMCELIKLL